MFIKASAAVAVLAPAGASAQDCRTDEAADRRKTGFVWRPMVPRRADIPALDGHTDTVPDIVGRLGSPIDLAIFTEGNHFPALLGGGVIEPFRSWTRAHPVYGSLAVDNIVIVTLPQPMIVAMLLGRGISFGNLTLDVSRDSGFYPDIVMAGAEPLKALHKAAIVEGEARVFARNLGFAMLIAAGNPLAVRTVEDLARSDIRIVMASENEPGARRQYLAALEGLLGQERTQAALARETVSFPGRLGIQHRDIIQAVASGAAEIGIIFRHLAQYYAAAYAEICSMVSVPGAEQYASTIAMAPAVHPLRARAAKAFAEFFLATARDLYPRHGFAAMNAADYGKAVPLG